MFKVKNAQLIKKLFVGCVSIALIALCMPMSFAATEQTDLSNNQTQMLGTTAYPPEGGCWEYGYNVMVVFSDYFQQTNLHKSSCIGVGGHEADSGWMPAGVKSVSSWGIDPLGNNHWYYDVR